MTPARGCFTRTYREEVAKGNRLPSQETLNPWSQIETFRLEAGKKNFEGRQDVGALIVKEQDIPRPHQREHSSRFRSRFRGRTELPVF